MSEENKITLSDIEQQARVYANARAILSDRVQALQAEIEAIKRRRLRGIKQAVGDCAQAHDALQALISDAPELFTKPRTKIFSRHPPGVCKAKGQASLLMTQQKRLS